MSDFGAQRGIVTCSFEHYGKACACGKCPFDLTVVFASSTVADDTPARAQDTNGFGQAQSLRAQTFTGRQHVNIDRPPIGLRNTCLLYTSDAADE